MLFGLSGIKGGHVGPLARKLFEEGGPHDMLLDAMDEERIKIMNLKVGQAYYFETFSKYWLGKVESVSPTEVVLTGASWVPDTGRFHEFFKNGSTQNTEIEPILVPAGRMTLQSCYITMCVEWPHDLPTQTK